MIRCVSGSKERRHVFCPRSAAPIHGVEYTRSASRRDHSHYILGSYPSQWPYQTTKSPTTTHSHCTYDRQPQSLNLPPTRQQTPPCTYGSLFVFLPRCSRKPPPRLRRLSVGQTTTAYRQTIPSIGSPRIPRRKGAPPEPPTPHPHQTRPHPAPPMKRKGLLKALPEHTTPRTTDPYKGPRAPTPPRLEHPLLDERALCTRESAPA
jgi:hypothetical protein